jgi:hypothetical protein
MRMHFFSIICFVPLAGCIQSRNNDASASVEITIKDLRPGETVHDSLTSKQLKQIKRIHDAFSEVSSTSSEEFIDGFKHHQNPDREIANWLTMVDAYERFTLNKHVEEHDKKQEAYDVILLRSRMSEEEVVKRINAAYLSKDELKEILSYYVASSQPLRIEK